MAPKKQPEVGNIVVINNQLDALLKKIVGPRAANAAPQAPVPKKGGVAS